MHKWIVNREEAARLLGISVERLWRYTHLGVIPQAAIVRVGRNRYYKRAVLEAWARGDHVQGGEEHQAEP